MIIQEDSYVEQLTQAIKDNPKESKNYYEDG